MKQQTEDEIFNYIKNYMIKHVYPPSIPDIINDTKMGRPTVVRYINYMLDKGRLVSDNRGSTRAYRIPGSKIVWK